MRLLLCCYVVFLVATGCNKETNTSITTRLASDVFPNQVGDQWIYSVNDTTLVRSAGTRVISNYNMTVTVTNTITLANGINANVWVSTYPGGSDTSYVFQSGDTVRFMSPQNLFLYTRQYPIPFMLNQSWRYTLFAAGEVTVVGQGTIAVGQNEFENAWHIQGSGGMPDAIFMVDEWVENNVGVVKRYINQDGELVNIVHHISWSLINYSLNS